jgi:hypothetical protein
MRITFPDSSWGRNASCCALLKRWIFLDPGSHRAEGDEMGTGAAGDDSSQRGLAGAGRPPEDERADFILLDGGSEGRAWTDDLVLAQELVEIQRAHALGEGGGRPLRFLVRRREEILLLHRSRGPG